jgi:hypothetical protein
VVDTRNHSTFTQYIKDGKINLVIHPVAAPWLKKAFTDDYTTRMAAAAYYIYQNDPEHFEDFFFGAFADESLPIDQKTDGSSGAYPFSDQDIQQVAAKLGVKPEVAANCTNEEYKKFVEAESIYLSGILPKNKQVGTPYFLVNDQELPDNKDVITTVKELLGEK